MLNFFKPNWNKFIVLILLAIISVILASMLTKIGLTPGFKYLAIFLGFPVVLIFMNGDLSFFLVALFIVLIWLYLLSCIIYQIIRLINYLISKIIWNKKSYSILAVTVILIFLLFGFFNLGFGDYLKPQANDKGVTSEAISNTVLANNKFAIDLYNKLNQNESGNIFFSPWSITNAVAMLYEGANGETKEEIKKVFYFIDDDYVRRAAYANLLNTLQMTGGKYKLAMANALWVEETYPIINSYVDNLDEYYLAKSINLNLRGDAIGSAKKINSWASKNTAGKITQVVKPEMFNSLSSLVLTNAIYFKGKWVEQFDPEDTKPKDFTLESGNKIQVDMMYQHNDEMKFNYAQSDGVQILEMPYQGDKISMLVLLPNLESSELPEHLRDYPPEYLEKMGFGSIENVTLNELENMLTAEKLAEWRSKMKPEEVAIYMPKYKFDTDYDLGELLKSLGMEKAFKMGEADFSKIGPEGLYVDKVLHKAYIDVYEEGTEAAAVTVISMGFMSALPRYKTFNANHPFLFILQDTETGNILFLGKVMNPNS